MPRLEASPLLLHVFSTFAVGGPQVRFAALARLWGDRYRHAILAMDGRYDAWDRLGPGVQAERMSVSVVKGRALSVSNLWRFRGVLRNLRPHALLTSNFGTVEWALANRLGAGMRHVHMEDGFGPDEAEGRQLPRRVRLRRVAFGPRTEVVVPSRGLHRVAAETWRVPPARLHHIPNGIDTARFAAVPDAALIPPGEGPLIGFVGALRPEKNVARLLAAVARLPADVRARLTIVGEGSERPALERLARELGLATRVRFLGSLDNPERVLGAFDLFALSSDTEQMPLSLLEAMAAGLPAVATDVGDVADMLSPANRPYVTARDPEALASAMAALLRAPDREAIGRANQAKARSEFDERRMAERYAALLTPASQS